MTTILYLDAVPPGHKAEPRVNVRAREDPMDLPAADVVVIAARGLPRHVLQRVFDAATDHLCRVNPPPRRNVA